MRQNPGYLASIFLHTWRRDYGFLHRTHHESQLRPESLSDPMPVLMHISDLHRSSGEPVSNAELVAALERDLDRQQDESPAIARPDALIVSGDLVKGGSPRRLRFQRHDQQAVSSSRRVLGRTRRRVVRR